MKTALAYVGALAVALALLTGGVAALVYTTDASLDRNGLCATIHGKVPLRWCFRAIAQLTSS